MIPTLQAGCGDASGVTITPTQVIYPITIFPTALCLLSLAHR
jgi:hypothetical protein